ncbi:MAG: LacI family transcriptional regulator [Clostridiales bacterium]|nr:LacI family transcriptional regulator [Clostridiales bacterium]
MNGSDSRVTLRDIALECGYSVNTISRALRGDSRLPGETRRRITEAADRLGYIRNNSASSLRSGHSYTVAVIQGDLTNMHYMTLLNEIDYDLRKNGYVVMILSSHDSPELERQLLNQAVSHNVDGIILLPTSSDLTSNLVASLSRRLPLVLVHRRLKGVEVDLVCEDDERGGYEAGSLLVSRGHRRFLYLSGPEYNSSEILRRRGFLRALTEAGLPEESVRIIPFEKMAQAIESQTVLRLLSPVNYTGIFAFYDNYAYQALYSLLAAGYRVPDDISIVGFDNIKANYRYLPPLASVSTAPGSSIARETVNLFLRRISDPDAKVRTVTLPVCIYDRELVGTARVRGGRT